ncbi:hypothetical protein [Thalassobacillus pellis]|nr:hypothetical protein [Thalassobacillus pellis]MBM7552222.1 hypothetical protein [Thalassobacillus pellis]
MRLEDKLLAMEDYDTAMLTEEMLKQVQDLEKKLQVRSNEPVILIAYTHR